MPKHPAPTIPVDPYEYAKLLQGRIALEFPISVFKEEKVTESYDKRTARYVAIWYNAVDDEEVNLVGRVETLASEVIDLDAKPWMSVEVSDATRSRDTSRIMVTYSVKEQPAVTTAAAEPALVDSTVLLQVADATYRVVSTDQGTTWDVVDGEGTAVESAVASVPEALGLALKHLLVDLSYVEEVSGGKETSKAAEDLDRNFLAAVLSWYVHSPVVTEKAKKHLVALVELITKHEFVADPEP